MPIDEYVAAGPEEEHTGQSHEPHSRSVHDLEVARILQTAFSTGASYVQVPEYPPLSFRLPSEIVVGQAMRHLASTIGIRAWATTERSLWQSIARGSTLGDPPRYLVAHQPFTTAEARQLVALWGDLREWFNDETVNPILEPLTQHDRRLATQATSLDLINSELLPQFEDD
jgi:hypothetical protein